MGWKQLEQQQNAVQEAVNLEVARRLAEQEYEKGQLLAQVEAERARRRQGDDLVRIAEQRDPDCLAAF